MTNNDQSRPDQDSNLNANNDNHKPPQGQVVAAALRGSTALTSLAALGAALNSVDTASVVGGSGLPMLSFKREGDGTWGFGQKRTIVEEGSSWAVNPTTFRWGFICFSESKKVLGERLVPISLPKPEIEELPDKGFKWNEQWTVNLRCIDGADAGVEVTYKPTTDGGIKAVAGLINEVRDRFDGGQHNGAIAPVVLLNKDSYPSSQYGRVWIPVLDIVDWIPLSGPAPTPAPTPASTPASPSTEPTSQPRRRRVG